MALYHTYRPQNFSDVVGQEHIVRTLENQTSRGKVAHAYLFSGPRGVGKTTLARILAKSVNCQNREENDSNPCNTCQSCTDISSTRSIDVVEIDAASHTGVDNVRENIIEHARFQPTSSSYKVFIIDEVHMLSTSAFNALLKTLEEPPAHAKFILATTELKKLPETIVSRCQRFGFTRVAYNDLKKHLKNISKLEEIEIDDDVLDRIIAKSDGCVRDAISLFEQVIATGQKHIDADIASAVLPVAKYEDILLFVSSIISKDISKSLNTLEDILQEGTDCVFLAEQTISFLRYTLILKNTPGNTIPGTDLDKKTIDSLGELGASISSGELVNLIDIFLHRKTHIRTSPIPQLPIEMPIIKWSGENNTAQVKKNNVEGGEEKKEIETVEKVAKEESITVESKKEVASSTPSSETAQGEVTKKDIDDNWAKFKTTIESVSPSLGFLLNMTTIRDVKDNTVMLSVPYPIHKDKLTELQTKTQIETIFSDLLCSPVKIDVVVGQGEDKKTDSELNELASLVGGTVIP